MSAGHVGIAGADGTVSPYVAEAYEHDTNIFDLPSSGGEPVGNHGPTFADNTLVSRAGVDGTYVSGLQKFFGTAEFRHFNYDNFTDLNHNELLLDGGLNWKMQQLLDGLFEYRHEERMVQFQDLVDSNQLIVETENNVTASLNVNMTPEWRLENKFKDHLLDSPRTNVPGLSLHEDSIREGLRYLGIASLSAGIDAEYLKGDYRHDPLALNPNYHQESVFFAANYIVSGLTTFTGDLGYTRRTDPTNGGDVSGVTGVFGYQHSLTGKTSINVQINRAINTYVTTAGSELDTTASLGLTWNATYRIAVKVGYAYTNSKFPDMPTEAGIVDRVDHFQTANGEIDFQATRWLMVRGYTRYLTRNSNLPIFEFDGTTYGIELVARRPGVTKP